MRSVNFDNPYLLLLAIPLLLIVIVPFIIAIRKENRQVSSAISLVIHIVMVVLVTLAAAGLKITTVRTETIVYVVADVSHSQDGDLDLIDEYIDEISDNLPRNTKLGVVCFGRDEKPEILYNPGARPKSVKEASKVTKTGTDIVSALEYTSNLYRDDVIKKMVLITDGKSTNSNTRGKLIAQMSALEQKKISLDAIFINTALEGNEHEVQIADTSFVKKTYLNNECTAGVLLQSSYEGQVMLTVSIKAPNSDEFVEQPYTIEDISYGYNTIKIPLKTDIAGIYEYSVTVFSDNDIRPENNTCAFSQEVDSSIDILLVTGEEQDSIALNEIYKDRATITTVIAKPGDKVVDLPYTVEGLTRYDEIILSNVDIRALPNVTSFLNAVEISVSQFGKTLTTMGDLNIQNRDDDSLGSLGEMLSVNYGNTNSNTKMYTLVLDTSHSMNQAYKLKATKDAAKSLLSLLSDDDMVCIISFSGDIETAQPPVRLGDARFKINQMIDGLETSQGTYVGTALNRALNIMKGYDYREKQIMLISDGKTNSYDKYDPMQVSTLLKIYKIVVSTINVVTVDEDSETLLKNIATKTGGKYYFLEDPENAGDFVFEDIADVITEFIITQDSPVYIESLKDKLIIGGSGEDDNIIAVPNVQQFVQMGIKPDSNLVLSVDYVLDKGTEDENVMRVPFYAWRDYGNGKVASLAAGPSGIWLSSWDDEFKSLIFGNMLSCNLPKEKNSSPFELKTELNGEDLRIVLTPASLRADASATYVITKPNGEKIEGSLIFDSKRYYDVITAYEPGRYDIEITYKYDENPDGVSVKTSHYVSYFAEYNMFAPCSASTLHEFVSGEVYEGHGLVIRNDKEDLATSEFRFRVLLLVWAVLLYIIDIAIRVFKVGKRRKKEKVKKIKAKAKGAKK